MVMSKFTVDLPNKLFIAKAGVTEFDVRVELYSEAKLDWIVEDASNKHTFPFLNGSIGGQTIDAGEGTAIPAYIFLQDGWRIRPDEADHTLKVTGGIILVQGGGDPFVDTLGAFTVRINYQQPVQGIAFASSAVAQTIRDAFNLISTGGIPAVDVMLQQVHQLNMLDLGVPVVVDESTAPQTITLGSITIERTVSGSQTTYTRTA